MKLRALFFTLLLSSVLSGCGVVGQGFPPGMTLVPTVSSPFPPGRVETMAVATITALAGQSQPAAPLITATPNIFQQTPTPQTLPATATLAPSRVFVTATLSGKPFAVQAVGPFYTANFANPTRGCAWQGVAGQVLRSNGEAITGIVVVVTGQLAGVKLNLAGVTGNQTTYGPGGYEVVLGSNPVTSSRAVFIQLFDTQGVALSEPYPFDTFATCSKNLAIINFQQVR